MMTTQHAAQSLIAAPILDAIQKLNPVATDEQRAALEQSLREIGQVNDIITAHDGAFVLDGRDLLAACKAVGIEPRIRDLGDLADDEMAAYAHHGNAMRKDLPAGARALMAAARATRTRGSNQHDAGAAPSIAQAAAEAGVSSDSVLRAKTVAASGCDALISKVAEGAIPVSVAEKLVKAAKGDSTLIERMVESGIGRVQRELYKDEVLKPKRERAHQLAAQNPVAARQLDDFAEGSFEVIQADFPWRYTNMSTGSGDPSHHYPLMSLDEIKAMPIGRLAAPNSVMFMWCVNAMLPEAIEVMKHFGFNYAHNIVWAKDSHVISNGAVISRHEILLVGRRGLTLHQRDEAKIPSWHWTKGETFEHSQKPAWFSEQIDRMYPDCTKLELFARAPRAGWTTWGNELVLPEAPNLETVTHNEDQEASNDETFERAV
ncbi:MT-A70 family methyltransferase [Burkholderia vietnamiensis]|uniref:MT-A70 family methyltransferase n=1 Tax=Burkholderia vietnamiensis TaxID=60552 RepID=UPI001B910A2F|nr:MT-A70 family methyltransferase [Burkholderia vietnamiensis]MBR8000400.1 hypothetical protein [Burkholderia vietnamiensis]